MDKGIHGWGHILRNEWRGKMGINRVVNQYGVLRTTLKDRLSGRVVQGVNPGPTPYLSIEEEAKLIQHLLTFADIGYPQTKNEVLAIVQQAVHKKRGAEAAEIFNGKGWWNRFVQRWPKVCLRKGDALATPRANAVTKTNITQYYNLLKTLDDNSSWGVQAGSTTCRTSTSITNHRKYT